MGEPIRSAAILNTVSIDSTGKIAVGLLRYLKSLNIPTVLCYGRGKTYDDDSYYLVDTPLEVKFHALMTRLFGNQGSYSSFATRRLIKFLRKRKVDTVYAISLHGYYLNEKMFLDYIAEDNVRLIYMMIDEYPFAGRCGNTGGCDRYLEGCGKCPLLKDYPTTFFFDRSRKIYRQKKEAYAKIKRKVFIAPEFVINKARLSPSTKDVNLQIFDEAVDLQMFSPRSTEALKKKLGISDNQIILVCIAPSKQERKGVRYFLELAREFEGDDRYIFVTVGYTGDKSVVPSNCIPVGYIYDENELAEYFSLGDLFVFPSVDDTMANACLDSLGCGTPLLCFNISGMPYIAKEPNAHFVEPRNVKALAEEVKKTGKKTPEIIRSCREYALSRFDMETIDDKLLKLAMTL